MNYACMYVIGHSSHTRIYIYYIYILYIYVVNDEKNQVILAFDGRTCKTINIRHGYKLVPRRTKDGFMSLYLYKAHSLK